MAPCENEFDTPDLVVSFQSLEGGRGVILQWRKLTYTPSARRARLTVTVIRYIDSYALAMGMQRE